MTGRGARIAAVMQLEWRIQRREPLTILYMLVLGLLAAAFASSGPVELVRNRGAVPRDAAWSLMLASTAITAFGQVITTMVAAVVVLRDRADRVDELLQATRLTGVEYRTAKLLAALAMLGLVYSAIPIGLTVGAILGGGSVWPAVRGSVAPYGLVVLPTMLAIGALQFAAGVLSGRLWVIVGLGLLLIWLWSAVTGAVDGGNLWRGAEVFDPFGSAPVLQATQGWTDAQRAGLAMPVSASMVAGRVLWMLAGGLAAGVGIWRGGGTRRSQGQAAVANVSAMSVDTAPVAVIVRGGAPTALAGVLGTARYTLRWMVRDAGWRVLSVLGMLNVGVHAWLDARPGATSDDVTMVAFGSLVAHSRLFLILLATIYAGELVWREREERSTALFDGLPVRDGVVVAGRVAGVIAAQCLVVALLAGGAAAAAMLGAGGGVQPVAFVGEAASRVLLPFIIWFCLSLAVHVAVQQKIVAHLCCIAAWVLLVVARGTADAPDAAPVWFAAVLPILISLMVVLLGWQRGVTGSTRTGKLFRSLSRGGR